MRVLAYATAIVCVSLYVLTVSAVDCEKGVLKDRMVTFAGNRESFMKLTDVDIPDLDKFTACWWVQTFVTTGTTADITYFTYTTDDEYKGSIFAKDIRSFKIYLNRLRVYGGSDFDIRYGIWHHLCFAWSNAGGDYQIYKDGLLLKEGSGFKTGEIIRGGGVLYVGQYLAEATGEFWAQRYSYNGNMDSFNFWNTVVEKAQVETLAESHSSSLGCGNLIAWTTFKDSDLVGVVASDTPLTGEPRANDCVGGHCDDKIFRMDSTIGSHGYVQSFQPVPNLKALTACEWVKTTDKLETIGLFGYRSLDEREGSFSIRNPGNLQLHVNGEVGVESGVDISGGDWHQICFTWESDGGRHQYYVDAELAASGENLAAGQTVQGGGMVIIGVPMRRVGVEFDWKNRCNHQMRDFNVWSSVLCQDTISEMYSKPRQSGCGDVISWHYYMGHDLSPDVDFKVFDDTDFPAET